MDTITRTLSTLPNELILMITELLPTLRDLFSLMLVNRHLAQLLTPLMLRQAAHLQTMPLPSTECEIFLCDDQSPHTKRRSVLHWAAAHGDCDLIEQLLTINKRTSRGSSTSLTQLMDGLDSFCMAPIHSAALNRHTSVVELLLKHGAKHQGPKETWASPLQFAIYWKLHDMIASLLCAGADPNSGNVWFGTMLHLAVAVNDPISVSMLVRAGAEVDIAFLGYTPLRMSCLLSHHDVTLCLTTAIFEASESPGRMLVGLQRHPKHMTEGDANAKSVFMNALWGLEVDIFNYQNRERDLCTRCKRDERTDNQFSDQSPIPCPHL